MVSYYLLLVRILFVPEPIINPGGRFFDGETILLSGKYERSGRGELM